MGASWGAYQGDVERGDWAGRWKWPYRAHWERRWCKGRTWGVGQWEGLGCRSRGDRGGRRGRHVRRRLGWGDHRALRDRAQRGAGPPEWQRQLERESRPRVDVRGGARTPGRSRQVCFGWWGRWNGRRWEGRVWAPRRVRCREPEQEPSHDEGAEKASQTVLAREGAFGTPEDELVRGRRH